MKCKKALEEISNYIDGELDPQLRAQLEIHLKACHKCGIVLDTTRKTIELYCDDKLLTLPDPLRERLHETLRRTWREKHH